MICPAEDLGRFNDLIGLLNSNINYVYNKNPSDQYSFDTKLYKYLQKLLGCIDEL